MLLSRFPRIRLGHLDTPLEPLTRLSAHLGGPNLYIKRDDCTGLATGGNKTRKLEFLMADALAPARFTTGLLAIFSALALMLAAPPPVLHW